GLLLNASIVDGPVESVGVWHSAHPAAVNASRPRPIDADPPGMFIDGFGGARKRMKDANRSTALTVCVPTVASVLVTSFGVVTSWQAPVSSRSVWNSSLVMPISTLYASPENNSTDLFCAFQPKRAIVPSLPLLFGSP